MVNDMSFHVNGAERAGRAKILTSATAYAALRIDYRDFRGIRIIRVGGDHLYGTHRTMTGTIAALDPIGQWDAVLLNPYGMAYLYGRLVSHCNGAYGPGRTDFTAFCTFRTTVATFVGHLGLHQREKSGRWP